MTKKQPKANFSEIAKLATDIKNLHQTCCEGNAIACVFGRVGSSVFSKLTLAFKILIILNIGEEDWEEDEEVKRGQLYCGRLWIMSIQCNDVS